SRPAPKPRCHRCRTCPGSRRRARTARPRCDSLPGMRSLWIPVALAAAACLAAPAGATPADAAQRIAEAERALDEGRAGEAVAIFESLAAERPDDPQLQAHLGRALSLADRYREAAVALERATAAGVRDVRTLLFLGSALWESGQPEAADPVLEQA